MSSSKPASSLTHLSDKAREIWEQFYLIHKDGADTSLVAEAHSSGLADVLFGAQKQLESFDPLLMPKLMLHHTEGEACVPSPNQRSVLVDPSRCTKEALAVALEVLCRELDEQDRVEKKIDPLSSIDAFKEGADGTSRLETSYFPKLPRHKRQKPKEHYRSPGDTFKEIGPIRGAGATVRINTFREWNSVYGTPEDLDAVRKVFIQAALDDASNCSFGKVHRRLRTVSGLFGKQLSDQLKKRGHRVASSLISPIENGDSVGLNALLLAMSECPDIYHLPTDEDGQLAGDVKNILYKKAGKILPSDNKVTILFDSIETIINEYKKGQIGIDELPHVGQIIQSLLQLSPICAAYNRDHAKQLKDIPYTVIAAGISATCPGANVSDWQLQQICGRTSAASDETLDAIARFMHVENQVELLAKLPYGIARRKNPAYFRKKYRLEMTEPVFQEVWNHFEHYESWGKWVKALRETRQLSAEVLANTMGITDNPLHAIENSHSNTTYKFKTIQRYIDGNPLNLPADEYGEVTPEARERLFALAQPGLISSFHRAWLEKTKDGDQKIPGISLD